MHTNALLDTLSDELCQVNTCVGHIARRQVTIGGFAAYSFPSPLASKDENDNGSGSDDVDQDNGASSSSDTEMAT